MNVELTKQENLFVNNFLEQCKNAKDGSSAKYFISFTLFSLIGLFMIVYTSILTLNNMVDRIIQWVLFPGIISGGLLILTGFVIWQYHKKNMEKQKLANIIRKLM